MYEKIFSNLMKLSKINLTCKILIFFCLSSDLNNHTLANFNFKFSKSYREEFETPVLTKFSFIWKDKNIVDVDDFKANYQPSIMKFKDQDKNPWITYQPLWNVKIFMLLQCVLDLDVDWTLVTISKMMM